VDGSDRSQWGDHDRFPSFREECLHPFKSENFLNYLHKLLIQFAAVSLSLRLTIARISKRCPCRVKTSCSIAWRRLSSIGLSQVTPIRLRVRTRTSRDGQMAGVNGARQEGVRGDNSSEDCAFGRERPRLDLLGVQQFSF
jgi:hypothetical protein